MRHHPLAVFDAPILQHNHHLGQRLAIVRQAVLDRHGRRIVHAPFDQFVSLQCLQFFRQHPGRDAANVALQLAEAFGTFGNEHR